MIDIPTDAYILNNFFLTSARFLFSIENLIGGYNSVFFPVNIKSAREPHFFELLHGHFFAFTGTLGDLFTGTFFWFAGRI